MKSIHFISIILLCTGIHLQLKAQTPGGINYQGVARNQFLVGLNNDSIQLRFTIREKSATGAVLYTETRGTRTDSFGVFNVVIGSTGAISQSGNIKSVPWSDTTRKFLTVEMNILDPNVPGFLNMGTTQLLSVPFSFYSDISDSARISSGSGRCFFSSTIDLLSTQNLPNSGDDVIADWVKIQFPVVLMNEGNHYNPATSEFTAPDSGIYQFDVKVSTELLNTTGSLPSRYNYYLNFYLVKNDLLVKSLGNRTVEYDSNSNMNYRTNPANDEFGGQVRMKLAKGDRISVRITNNMSPGIGLRLSYTNDPAEVAELYTIIDKTFFAEFSGFKIK